MILSVISFTPANVKKALLTGSGPGQTVGVSGFVGAGAGLGGLYFIFSFSYRYTYTSGSEILEREKMSEELREGEDYRRESES